VSDRLHDLVADDDATALDAARRALAAGRSRELVAEALGRVGGETTWERALVLERLPRLPGSVALLDPLLEALRDPADAQRRNSARSVLAALASRQSEVTDTATEMLASALGGDSDSDVRVLAATALGESGNAAARPPLEAALDDTEINVCAAAADALGVLGDPRAIGALSRAVETADFWVRVAAVVSLGRLGDRRASEALAAALSDPLLAEAAVGAIGDVADPRSLESLRPLVAEPGPVAERAVSAAERILSANPSVEPPEWLREAVRGREPELARALAEQGDEAAAHLLGIAGTEDAAHLLVDALSTPESRAAAAALHVLPAAIARSVLIARLPATGRDACAAVIAALPPLDDADSVDAVALFLGTTDDATRAAAIEALARSEPAMVLPRLSAALDDPGTRHAAVRVLGLMGDDRCAPLAALLGDRDARVRHAAAEGLTRCATPEIRNEIVAALRLEKDPAVREALIGALGAAGGPESVAALEPLLGHDDPAVRFAAVRALGRTRAADALAPLVRLLAEPSREVQGAALLALGDLGDPRAAEPVAERLGVMDGDIRLTAALALRDLGTTRVVEYLVRALDDSSWSVRYAAVKTLAALDAREALEGLRTAAAADPDRLVRDAAREAVRMIEGEESARGGA